MREKIKELSGQAQQLAQERAELDERDVVLAREREAIENLLASNREQQAVSKDKRKDVEDQFRQVRRDLKGAEREFARIQADDAENFAQEQEGDAQDFASDVSGLEEFLKDADPEKKDEKK